MLRAEPGVYYADLYPLVCLLPRYAYLTDGSKPDDLLPMWQASLNGKRRSVWRPPAVWRPHTVRHSSTTLSVSVPLDEVTERNWYRTDRTPTTEFDPEKVLPTVYSDIPLRPSRDPRPHGFLDYFPIFRPFEQLFSSNQENHDGEDEGNSELDAAERKRKNEKATDSNVPLEIVMYLNAYNAFLLKNGFLPPAAATALTNALAGLHDAISGLDRIRTTPLPFAYQAHLRMSLW